MWMSHILNMFAINDEWWNSRQCYGLFGFDFFLIAFHLVHRGWRAEKELWTSHELKNVIDRRLCISICIEKVESRWWEMICKLKMSMMHDAHDAPLQEILACILWLINGIDNQIKWKYIYNAKDANICLCVSFLKRACVGIGIAIEVNLWISFHSFMQRIR